MNPESRKFEISLKNEMNELERFKKLLNRVDRKWGIHTTILVRMHIVFDELLSNIVKYAFDDNAEHTIEIAVENQGDRIIACFKDDGIYFDPFEHRESDEISSLKKDSIGGFGIPIMKEFMDEVRYERSKGKNIVTIVKRITSPVL